MAPESERPTSRIALRKILLEGLEEGAALRDSLVSIAQSREDRAVVLRTYKREMIKQGFEAVNASLAEMRQLNARLPLSQFMSM